MCSQCTFIHLFRLYNFDNNNTLHFRLSLTLLFMTLQSTTYWRTLPLCSSIYSLYTLIIYLLALYERCNFGITIILFKMQLSATLYLSTISSFHIKFYRWLQCTSNTALHRPCTISNYSHTRPTRWQCFFTFVVSQCQYLHFAYFKQIISTFHQYASQKFFCFFSKGLSELFVYLGHDSLRSVLSSIFCNT